MRLLLCLPRCHSASQLFPNIGVPALQAVIRNLVFKLITINVVIQGLVKIGEGDLRFTSTTWKHWYELLYSNFDNG